MSYTLCMWDPARQAPLPTSHLDALAIMARLRVEPATSTHELRALGAELVAHWNALPPDTAAGVIATREYRRLR